MENIFKKAASFLDRAPELWKENVELVELNRRFLWFLFLRFGVVAVMFGLGFTKNILIPGLGITSPTLFAVGGILLLINIIYWCHYEWVIAYTAFPSNVRRVAANVQIQMILDFLILGYIVYECGGIESPLIYFFLFHNTLSCLFFRKRVSFLHTLLAVGIIALIFSLTETGAIPRRHFIAPAVSPTVNIPGIFAMYYLAGIVFIYFTCWYLVSSITQSLKTHERELQEKIQEMIDLAHEKNRYLLVTTHELKAPFAAIQSYVNVALDGYAGELSDKLKDILWKIRARCNTLVNMITNMIQLTNLTSIREHQGEFTTSRLLLSEVILNILPRFRETAAAKRLRFDTEGLSKGHIIAGNEQQLDMLFNNVIGNAINYSFPETKITISVKEKESAFVTSVNDIGIPVKKEHLEKVFLEHFRSEKAVEMNPNSTGLGLTIARQIMDIHGGRIWIESDETAGTTVFMEFPKPSE